jgi:hypothetical protein
MANDKTEQILYPGSFTLENIENDLVVKENNRTENLTKLEILADGPNGEHRSQATLTELPFGTVFGRLFLVEAPADELDDIKKEQEGKERDFLFTATIWVSNKKTQVAAFRERTEE